MDETRIQIISDLHLEAPAAYDIFSITPRAPFLALLGDVGYVQDEGFFDFLSKQLAAFRVVFLILGNHEPYHSSWTETKAKLESFGGKVRGASAGEAIGELVVLDQTRYDISPTVTILGCTLFSRVAQDQSDNVSFGLNDFYHIRNWSLESHQEAHRADLRWLNEEIDSISQKEPGRKIVVLTHYYRRKFAGGVRKLSYGLLDIHISTVTSEIQGPAKECYRTREATTSLNRPDLTARRLSSFDGG